MSKIFYDRFIILEEIEVELDNLGLEAEERQELDQLIDEMIHHRVLDRILTHLPKEHHIEFLERFHKAPYDESLIDYLNEKVERSVEEHVREEIGQLKKEILEDVKSSKK
ncbi:MAG: hypothetical protein Q7S60_02705 [bacterium]|nr:hypothetical protein [bacterium]